jgi:hypothetical protein
MMIRGLIELMEGQIKITCNDKVTLAMIDKFMHEQGYKLIEHKEDTAIYESAFTTFINTE